MEQIRRILIIKLSSLGDVIQALPVLKPLKELYPEASITWAVEEESAGILKGHPWIDNILVFRRRAWVRTLRGPRLSGSALRDVLREVREFINGLRGREYDLVLDLQGLLRSGILVGLSRSRRKIGLSCTRELGHLFLNKMVPVSAYWMHAVDRYLSVVKALGGQVNGVDFGLIRSIPHPRSWRRYLEGLRLDMNRPWFVLSPMARWDSKLWEPWRWAELIDLLVDLNGHQVVLIGTAKERPYVEAICRIARERVLNLAGQTDLRALSVLVRGASCVISTDSGPMHLASALGVPVVVLFGPTSPIRTGPYGTGHRILQKPLPCAPCFKRTCISRKCMRDIEVEEVMEAVEGIMGG